MNKDSKLKQLQPIAAGIILVLMCFVMALWCISFSTLGFWIFAALGCLGSISLLGFVGDLANEILEDFLGITETRRLREEFESFRSETRSHVRDKAYIQEDDKADMS